jgi:hypothetical protein
MLLAMSDNKTFICQEEGKYAEEYEPILITTISSLFPTFCDVFRVHVHPEITERI